MKKVGLVLKDEGKFEVAVATDEKLSSSGCCKGVCMVLPGEPNTIDLYLLLLQGSDKLVLSCRASSNF